MHFRITQFHVLFKKRFQCTEEEADSNKNNHYTKTFAFRKIELTEC